MHGITILLNAHKTHHTKVCHLSKKQKRFVLRGSLYISYSWHTNQLLPKNGGYVLDMVMGRFDGLAEHQMRGMGCHPVKCLLVDEVYDPRSIINIRIYQRIISIDIHRKSL